MKKILIPIFLVVFAFQAGNSQTTNQKRIHGSTSTEVKKLIKLPNGGWTVLSENRLYSLDASENVIWSKKFPPLADGTDFSGSAIVRLDDGSYVIAGTFLRQYVRPNNVVTLIKTDASGNIIWSKQIEDNGRSSAASIIKTSDGGFALTGQGRENAAGKVLLDAFVIKLDGNANFEWASIIGAGGSDYQEEGNSLIQTKDGGYAVTGLAYVYNASDMFVAKLSSTGALLWSKYFGDGGYDRGTKIIEATDGGLAVIGNHGTVPTFGYTTDYFLVKLTSSGTLQWAKYYGGNDNDYSGSFIQTSDGSYLITGGSYSFNNTFYKDCYNLKTDASGNVLISKATPGNGNVIFTDGSGYIVGGFDDHTFPYDGVLIKLDANLNTCNSRSVTTITNTSTRSVDAAFHKKGRIFTVSPLAFTSENSTVTVSQICSTSSVIAKTPESAKQEFTAFIFPNPVKDNLHVQLSASSTVNAELRIINQMGVVFISKNALITSDNQTEIINTSSLKNGMYFLSVSTKEGNKLIPFSKQ